MHTEIVYYAEYKCEGSVHAREIAVNEDNEKQ